MKANFTFILFCLFCLPMSIWAVEDASYKSARANMVSIIEQDVKDTSLYIDTEVLDPAVMRAMATVPRHEFVLEEDRDIAYINHALAIDYGQTISQP